MCPWGLGATESQTEALFDIRIVDTEVEKKHKYLQACQDRHATFTPLCVSVDGMLGSEAEFFIKRLGDFLAARWERPYGVVMG